MRVIALEVEDGSMLEDVADSTLVLLADTTSVLSATGVLVFFGAGINKPMRPPKTSPCPERALICAEPGTGVGDAAALRNRSAATKIR